MTGFGNSFLGFANQILSQQFRQTQNARDYSAILNQNAMALTNATIQSSNQFFYSLAGQQTQALSNLGQQYAEIAKTAASRIQKPGLFGFIFG